VPLESNLKFVPRRPQSGVAVAAARGRTERWLHGLASPVIVYRAIDARSAPLGARPARRELAGTTPRAATAPRRVGETGASRSDFRASRVEA